MEIDRVLQGGEPHVILGIDEWADAGDVRRAYRRLALLLHPDNCLLDQAVLAFRSVRTAYEAMEV